MQPQDVVISGTDVNTSLTFIRTSSQSMNIPMRINDDTVGLESEEIFNLRLVDHDPRVITGGGGHFAITRIIIDDDDGLSVCLSV